MVQVRENKAQLFQNSESFSKSCDEGKDYSDLLENPKDTCSDLVIITNDGEEFKAHKRILTARCPALISIWGNGIEVKRLRVMKVNLSSYTVHFLLKYIYTTQIPQVPMDLENKEFYISDVISVAIRLQLEELVHHFNETLAKFQSEDNVKFLRETAEKFGLDKAFKKLTEVVQGKQDPEQLKVELEDLECSTYL